MKAVDPAAAARLHPNDVRRVVRALEIYRITGRTQSEQAALDAQRGDGPFSERVYALDWPREALYARIDRRVDEMLQSGLVDEVRRLMKNEAAFSTAAQAIGYKEIAAALRGECALAEAVETLKRATRNYAKRQLTWFRRDARVRWVAAQGLSAAEIAEKIITRHRGQTMTNIQIPEIPASVSAAGPTGRVRLRKGVCARRRHRARQHAPRHPRLPGIPCGGPPFRAHHRLWL